MRAVVQRVSNASVLSDGVLTGDINKGLLILLGIEHDDHSEDAEWLSEKIRQMRIFSDSEGKMNLSVEDVGGELMVISQFTLHASTKKGNRPSFIKAARPEQANELYNFFKECLIQKTGKEIACGVFGTDMKISLVNDGPVTIIIDSRNKE
ncbi:MAG: D-tyrosyl-tRNA(Tyr) deacylase [Saprospiraceae bacterium]|uniref:D-aminoacyl-tRNA deacylase n=1 Tax=Candidatus Opimibacter skivensis TaxID=2982028 RepID=A0A9D7SVJ3_9BACT|nr:D-tyrosyl-tRNA(Tyr) deacylase [Candidatus Opimibacter skivensis]